MIKVNTSVQLTGPLLELTDDVKHPIDKKTMEEVGSIIVEQIQKETAKGRSPIAGKGSFPAYKNPDKYPGTQKPHTPVNLRLTGDMMDSLTHKAVSDGDNYSSEVFYSGRENDKKEQGHREGANKQPKRPTIPVGSEKFTKQISDLYIKVIQERLFRVLTGKG